jgi:uncharacterized glyoxalase superfamily protein PhnB
LFQYLENAIPRTPVRGGFHLEWILKLQDEIGGAETRSAYVIVSDPHAIYLRGEVRRCQNRNRLKDEDYGGRGFTCRDLEGHLWSFGSYDPWSD